VPAVLTVEKVVEAPAVPTAEKVVEAPAALAVENAVEAPTVLTVEKAVEAPVPILASFPGSVALVPETPVEIVDPVVSSTEKSHAPLIIAVIAGLSAFAGTLAFRFRLKRKSLKSRNKP